LPIYAASSTPRSLALRIAPFRACIRYRCWMRGARRNGRLRRLSRLAGSCTSN